MMKPDCSCSRPPMRPPQPRPEPPCCCDCCQCQNRPKPPNCGCSCCAPEGRHPCAAAGFLLPRIMASGRTWQRRLAATLTVTGLPACAEPPFTLQWVAAACEAPTWEPLPCDHPRQLRLCATIPLLCQIRDCHGCCYYGRSSIQTEVCLSLTCPAPECWRHAVVLLPCVRLACVPCTACEPCFDAQLELLLEAYLLRWEPCAVGAPRPPVCPDLPLYPQPCIE